MAISPPSDIVLDVARAVDPQALAEARSNLMSRAGMAASASFETVAAGAAATPAPSVPGLSREAASPGLPDASRKFEAMVLQTFISSMMPKNTEGTFGKGLAGEMWKGLMAEKIADVVAGRGGIGIADRVLGDFRVEDDTKVAVAGIRSEQQFAEDGRTRTVASSLVDEIEGQLTRDLGSRAQAKAGGVFGG